MKCRIMRHFIRVFTVCLSTHLGVSSIQRFNQRFQSRYYSYFTRDFKMLSVVTKFVIFDNLCILLRPRPGLFKTSSLIWIQMVWHSDGILMVFLMFKKNGSLQMSRNTDECTVICLFVWFDSLRPINNFSVKQGRVFLGRTSTKLGKMCLAQGPQRSDASEARTCGPSVSSQALSRVGISGTTAEFA